MSESEIVFRSDVTVELVKASASDADVIWAARVSTAGEQSMEEIGEDPARSEGLINYLARERTYFCIPRIYAPQNCFIQ